MKKLLILALLTALLLSGCSGEKFDPGFDKSWTNVGNLIGVEPVEGFAVNENMDALGPTGLYYATWTSGAGETITNDEGKEATVYDAQIYLLIEQCKDAETAESDLGKWIALEKQSYETGEMYEQTFASQSFRILPLLSSEEDNPYAHGITAFGLRGNSAISVELLCTDAFAGDPKEILAQFLSGLHYVDY